MLVAVSSAVGPVVFSLTLQDTTSAAIDITFAMGANVAAMRGIAVEANHQSLLPALAPKLSPSLCSTYEGSSSSSARKVSLPRWCACVRGMGSMTSGGPAPSSPGTVATVSRRSSSCWRFCEKIPLRSLPLDPLRGLGTGSPFFAAWSEPILSTNVITWPRPCCDAASSELWRDKINARCQAPLMANTSQSRG
jgi:hypothetical protein